MAAELKKKLPIRLLDSEGRRSKILNTKISKVEESEALRSLAVNPSGCSGRPNLILEKLHAVARAASLDCWF